MIPFDTSQQWTTIKNDTVPSHILHVIFLEWFLYQDIRIRPNIEPYILDAVYRVRLNADRELRVHMA